MKFISPAKMCTLGASVTGTVETGYDADALCDGDPSNPVRTTSTGASFTATGTSVAGVNGVVLAHTNLIGGLNVTIGSDLSGTLVTPAVPNDGIPLNGWKEVTPATADSVSITLSGNDTTVVIGELIAGVLETIGLRYGASFQEDNYRIAGDSPVRRVGYDMGYASRILSMDTVITAAQLASIEAWRRACRQTSRPSVLIPYDTVNDAWLVMWERFESKPWAPTLFQVSMSWRELTRTRW